MKYIAPILGIALTAAAVTGLQHQVRSEQLHLQSFANLDRDGSGTIGKRETEDDPLLQELFADLDENEDGQLTRAEYAGAVRYPES